MKRKMREKETRKLGGCKALIATAAQESVDHYQEEGKRVEEVGCSFQFLSN